MKKADFAWNISISGLSGVFIGGLPFYFFSTVVTISYNALHQSDPTMFHMCTHLHKPLMCTAKMYRQKADAPLVSCQIAGV